MKLTASIILVCALSASAATYTLPTANQGWWTAHTAEQVAGVGVPDGFLRFTAGESEDRAVSGNVIDVTQSPYNADNTGSSDATAAINSAIAAASAGDVVYLPAGSYRIDTTLVAGVNRDEITIRGDGPDQTILKANGADDQKVFNIGIGFNSWAGGTKVNVSGTRTKGTTTLTVPDSSVFTTNDMAMIYVENELDTASIEAGAIPTWSSGNFAQQRNWAVMITGKPTGTTITIDPPLLLDCTNYDVQISPADGSQSDNLFWFGVEDLKLEDVSSATTFFQGFWFARAVYCWMYNVEVVYQDTGAAGSCAYWYGAYRSEIRKCKFDGNPSDGDASFSDGALQVVDMVSCLIEDNIFHSSRAENSFGWDVGIYSDGRCNNTVISYNFFEQCHKNVLINHTGGHALMMLFEGNIGQRVQQDGYYSNISYCTAFRNWWAGMNMSTNSHPSGGYVSWYKRFTRDFALVGEVWGWDDESTGGVEPQYGYPNIGNDNYGYGTATHDGSNNASTLTDSGESWTVNEWVGYRIDNLTDGSYGEVTANTATTMTVTLTGGTDNDFDTGDSIGIGHFAQPTAGYFWGDWGTYTNGTYAGGTDGFQEIDLDVEPSFELVHNYIAANPGPGSLQNSTVDTLPDSFIYSSKPSWLGSLAWPTIDPDSPAFNREGNAAGYRFYNGIDPSAGAPAASGSNRRVPSRSQGGGVSGVGF